MPAARTRAQRHRGTQAGVHGAAQHERVRVHGPRPLQNRVTQPRLGDLREVDRALVVASAGAAVAQGQCSRLSAPAKVRTMWRTHWVSSFAPRASRCCSAYKNSKRTSSPRGAMRTDAAARTRSAPQPRTPHRSPPPPTPGGRRPSPPAISADTGVPHLVSGNGVFTSGGELRQQGGWKIVTRAVEDRSPKRGLLYAHEGAVRVRYLVQQTEQAWCLTLATNAVVAWTTGYCGLAVESMRAAGRRIDDEVLAHVSPAHSENINFSVPSMSTSKVNSPSSARPGTGRCGYATPCSDRRTGQGARTRRRSPAPFLVEVVSLHQAGRAITGRA